MTWMLMGTSLRPTFTTVTGTSPAPFLPPLAPGGGDPLLAQPYRPKHPNSSQRLRLALSVQTINGILPRTNSKNCGPTRASIDKPYRAAPAGGDRLREGVPRSFTPGCEPTQVNRYECTGKLA